MTNTARTIFLQIGRRRYQVPTVEAASLLFTTARDKASTGASRTPTPILTDEAGKPFGYISYNGRVWAGSPRDPFVPGRTPLCEAQYGEGN